MKPTEDGDLPETSHVNPHVGEVRGIRVICISDTHEFHRELVLPAGDVLIHAGDLTFMSRRPSMLKDFDRWVAALPYRAKIVVPGNHDYLLEASDRPASLLPHATLLINEGTEVLGLKIWGTPTTTLYGGAFGRSDDAERRKIFEAIPEGLDILISHAPPLGILDLEADSRVHAGDPCLADIVAARKPRVHVFGHIHGSHGVRTVGCTTFVNASQALSGAEVQPTPKVLQLAPRRARD